MGLVADEVVNKQKNKARQAVSPVGYRDPLATRGNLSVAHIDLVGQISQEFRVFIVIVVVDDLSFYNYNSNSFLFFRKLWFCNCQHLSLFVVVVFCVKTMHTANVIISSLYLYLPDLFVVVVVVVVLVFSKYIFVKLRLIFADTKALCALDLSLRYDKFRTPFLLKSSLLDVKIAMKLSKWKEKKSKKMDPRLVMENK